jgi:hypothetical protein
MKCLLVVFILGIGMAGVGAYGAFAASPNAPPIFPACSVTLSETSTTATATIISGCIGEGFAFSSFSGQHTNDLFNRVTGPPWTVTLPPCLWQIDFSFGPGTPNHHIYAAALGGMVCPPPTTTTTTTTTTTLPVAPPPPVSGLAPPPPPPLASIPTEQGEIAGSSQGVTKGSG